MTTRRGFLESLFAVGAALPALRDDALPRLARVARQADRRPVDDITRDEISGARSRRPSRSIARSSTSTTAG